MTEQKEILERISNLAFDIQHTDALQVAFDKAQAIQNLVEELQPFKVGEYYAFNDLGEREIFKVLDISEGRMFVKSYRVNLDSFKEISSYTTGNSIAVTDSKPATSEEIALFKRAEHFHSKGRKLNEFKSGDLVNVSGEYEMLKNVGSNTLYTKSYGMTPDKPFLFMTAEELEAAAKEVEG